MYRLKKGQEAFELVDGPMAGRKFVPGRSYEEIPAQEKRRFEKISKPAAARKQAPATKPEIAGKEDK